MITDGRSQALLVSATGTRLLTDGVPPRDARPLADLPACPLDGFASGVILFGCDPAPGPLAAPHPVIYDVATGLTRDPPGLDAVAAFVRDNSADNESYATSGIGRQLISISADARLGSFSVYLNWHTGQVFSRSDWRDGGGTLDDFPLDNRHLVSRDTPDGRAPLCAPFLVGHLVDPDFYGYTVRDEPRAAGSHAVRSSRRGLWLRTCGRAGESRLARAHGAVALTRRFVAWVGDGKTHVLRFGRPRRSWTWSGHPTQLRATERRLFAIRGTTVRILDVP